MSNVGQGGREGDEHPSQEHTLTIFPYGCARHNTSSSCVITQAERLHRREFSKSCAKSFHPFLLSIVRVFFPPHSLWNVTCIDLFVNLNFLWKKQKRKENNNSSDINTICLGSFFFFSCSLTCVFFLLLLFVCFCFFYFIIN